jgi:hypothetical protein
MDVVLDGRVVHLPARAVPEGLAGAMQQDGPIAVRVNAASTQNWQPSGSHSDGLDLVLVVPISRLQ